VVADAVSILIPRTIWMGALVSIYWQVCASWSISGVFRLLI